MITYIDSLLMRWAQWTKVRRDGGLGYPSEAAGFKLRGGSGGRGDIIGVDEQSIEIERIVTRMRQEKGDLFKVVDWFYLAGNMTKERIARELGCSRDTVYSRLHSVHLYVMDALHDNEIERQDRLLTRSSETVASLQSQQKNFVKVA